MKLLSKIKNFLRGKKGTGSVPTIEPLQEGHELKLEDEIQTTFNNDNLDVLVEEGVVENVIRDED